MKYTFVKPDGSLGQTRSFDVEPPSLSASKGRWLPDIQPVYNPLTHSAIMSLPVDPQATGIGYILVPRPNADILADRLAQLSELRYAKETGGITVFGASIATDRASQFALTGAYTSLKEGLLTSSNWKTPNGWVSMNLAQVAPIAQAVASHVEGCFTREKQLYDVLKSLESDPVAVANYDITTGWPT